MESLKHIRVTELMAFYIRIVWVVLALIIAPPYSSLPDYCKTAFPIAGIVLLVAVFGWVAFLNYTRPELLIYGADNHFEKWRMEYIPGYGSEKGATTQRDAN